MSEAVDEAQNAMTPDEIEFWNKIKHGNCPCGGRLVPHIEHWVADEIDWVKAVGLECENRCGFDLNMIDALIIALGQAAEIEQLRAENDRLISDIKMITAPVEVGGGAVRQSGERCEQGPVLTEHEKEIRRDQAMKQLTQERDDLRRQLAQAQEREERLRRELDSVVDIAAAALNHVRKRYNGDSDSFGDIEEALLDAGFTMNDLDASPGLGQAREDALALLNSTTSQHDHVPADK